jgi:excisionase family DNA binding protein
VFDITPEMQRFFDELADRPLPEFVDTGVLWLREDFAVVIDPPFPSTRSEADERRKDAALDYLLDTIVTHPDPDSLHGARFIRRGWTLTLEPAFAAAVNPAPGNVPLALTAREVRDLLRCSLQFVYDAVARGDLEGYRIGRAIRIYARSVDAFKGRTATRRCPAPVAEPVRELPPLQAGFVHLRVRA